ncbi:MAG: fructosamine kinase family protein [Pseudomonadota bacterium]|nr:fructosamine kinase family protein [Pseudomonadota bacterium]
MSEWKGVCEAISRATGQPAVPAGADSLGGGCINQAFRLSVTDGRSWFVKVNDAASLAMFEAESAGLLELASANAIRVPQPVCCGSVGQIAYLVMEYIPLGRGGDAGELGRCLAVMHRRTAETFGWETDNTIGSTPQINTPDSDWVRFWRERRLGFQLRLAANRGYGGSLQKKGARLMERFPALFDTHTPEPSLLHGDLWGGNWSTDARGDPVIFDPAVYYGDREADLAMTELFGGFGEKFYRAYRADLPLDPGYSLRKTFYNIYHILNHLNLFGGGYGAQAEGMIDRVLAEL